MKRTGAALLEKRKERVVEGILRKRPPGPLVRLRTPFVDENKVAGFSLEEETRSILRTQASGDHVMTLSDYSLWSTRSIMPQSGADVKHSNQSAAEDAAYMDALPGPSPPTLRS